MSAPFPDQPTVAFRMTPAYDHLLRGSEKMPVGICQLQLTTAEQLCRLHYSPGSIKAVKARLKTLVDHGYAQADSIPTKRFRSPYYYTMGPLGMRYLEGLGLDLQPSWRASKETWKHALFLEHTLELNDVLISASFLQRPACSLEYFVHERTLKRTPYRAEWVVDGRKLTFRVIPDAVLSFRVERPDGSKRRIPLLLEHDRGTEEQRYFRRRIRAYIMLLRTRAYEQSFGIRAVTVAFTTFMGQKRVEQMRNWTRLELAAAGEPESVGRTFCFAALPRELTADEAWVGPYWSTPYEDDQARFLPMFSV